MKDNYARAYREVYEMIKELPNEYEEKLPKDLLEMYKAYMDKQYDFKIDLNKSYDEQNFCEEAEYIISNLFRDYWATPNQKAKIEAKDKYDKERKEEEKREKFASNSIFKQKNIRVEANKEDLNFTESEKSLNIVKKESFWTKITHIFKNLFRKK